jgi:hypothetical protein
MFVKPSLRPGVAALAEWLRDHAYSAFAAERVLNHVAVTGCLASAAYLDREDESEATEVFVAALPEVADDSPAWDREDVFMDVELIQLGTHPWPIPTVGDDDRTEPDDFAAAALEDLALPPISGGAPADEPATFEPTAEDLADFGRWSEALERRREMAEWYGRNPIAGFNADRPD